MGWRYLFFTAGGLVLVMSLLRVTVLRFEETPKFLVCQGRDEQVVNLFQKLAKTYGRPIDLTLEDLQRHGQVTSTHSRKRASLSEIWVHYRGLFMTRKTGMSTTLVWFSWALIGLAYPLFYFFLPDYLASRGARFGETSAYITWRNYTLAQVCAIFGPLLAAYLCQFRRIGRKYTMLIGAMISMAFFFSYTAVRNNDENVAFNCVISFATNIYYGTLYAYSPEVMPSAHRSTGNGTAVACNRIMGIMSAVVATYASPSTAAPVYICAALFGVMGLVAVVFPFEPERAQSM
ncbi:Filamentous Growth Regulator [Exophiala oligosperma]